MTLDNSYNQGSQSSPFNSGMRSPIVLLHGWGMNKNIWQPFVDSLPVELQERIQLLDLPGYGDNTQMPERYDLNSLSQWLNQQVTDKSFILGWSLGGLVAQQFAFEHPSKVEKLGLIASTPKFMSADDWFGIDEQILTMFADQLKVDHQQTIERFLAIQAMGARSAKQDIKRIRDLVLAAPTPNLIALQQGLELLKVIDLRATLASIDIPVSAIFGRLDSLVPKKSITHIEKLPKNSHITILPKASHAPFISHLDEFNQWFENFLN